MTIADFFHVLVQYASIIGALGVLITLALWLHKKIVSPVSKGVARLVAIAETQLVPANGSSLVEKLDDVVAKQDELKESFDKHAQSQHHPATRRALHAIDQRFVKIEHNHSLLDARVAGVEGAMKDHA